jgi:hypothetical protein
MAITQTNLTADLGINDTQMSVAAGAGFPGAGVIANPGWLVRIDKEYLLAISQPVTNTIKIAQRGFNGTAAAAHDLLAKVTVSSSGSDFPDSAPGNLTVLPANLPSMTTIGENRIFTVAEVHSWGNQPQLFAITKATAAAVTLVAPGKDQDGLVVTFTSLTAAAHVITATALLNDAVTGGPHGTITFAAFAGSGITMMAQNGLWNVMASVVAPIT